MTSALVRTTRVGQQGDVDALLAVLAADTGEDGTVTLLRADAEQVQRRAVEIVRDHALRSLEAMHLAVATLAAVPLLDPGDPLLFITVPEPKTVKNRVHLDVSPIDDTRDEEVTRLLGLDATLVDDQRRPDGRGWVVLADPEGNEFCVEAQCRGKTGLTADSLGRCRPNTAAAPRQVGRFEDRSPSTRRCWNSIPLP